jgi:cell shape-determining protein MreC
MKKFWIISLILSLILFTAVIKNSTKKIEDEIFIVKENIQSLKKEFGDVKLEFDYLSSAEKLMEYKDLYFEDEFVQKEIQEIKIINKKINELYIEKIKFADEQ